MPGDAPINGVRRRRADAERNRAALLDVAAEVFAEHGVDAPVREVALRAGVGMGTLYRHFPTRADLIVAVYRHQVEACAAAGPVLLAEKDSPREALVEWIDRFVDLLVTKHGLADAVRSDEGAFARLHAWFLDQLVPTCGALLNAAVAAGEVRDDVAPEDLLRAVGDLCAGAEGSGRQRARRMVGVLLDGLGRAPAI